MNIPQKFEYMATLVCSKGHPQIPKHVTILDVFAHHYTGENMYHIRIEYMSHIFNNCPIVEYKTIEEEQLLRMLENAIN